MHEVNLIHQPIMESPANNYSTVKVMLGSISLPITGLGVIMHYNGRNWSTTFEILVVSQNPSISSSGVQSLSEGLPCICHGHGNFQDDFL